MNFTTFIVKLSFVKFLSLELLMDHIHYSRIHVIYMSRQCTIGFALHNIRDIFC